MKSAYLFAPRPFFGSLHHRRGRIERLSPSKTPKRIERIILPGFITTHIHSIQTHARNTAENLELLDWLRDVIWPFEAKLTGRTAYESALTGMQECAAFGITTLLDMATTRHTTAVFEAARDVGVRAFIGKALMDQGPRSLIEKKPLDEVYDLLAKWHGFDDGRLQVSLCPRFALSCSPALLREVGRLSRELGLLHHTHASENKKECEWIEKHHGCSNIAYLASLDCLTPHTIIAHGVHLSGRDHTLLKKNQVSLSHCPTSNLKLASGIADLKGLQEKGISLSLGVDGAACSNLLDPFFEMRIAHLLSRAREGLRGVSAESIFQMATLGGAKALHAESEIGSLEVGKSADFIVMRVPERVKFNQHFPYESLLHSLTAHDIEEVYVKGRKI